MHAAYGRGRTIHRQSWPMKVCKLLHTQEGKGLHYTQDLRPVDAGEYYYFHPPEVVGHGTKHITFHKKCKKHLMYTSNKSRFLNNTSRNAILDNNKRAANGEHFRN